MENYRQQVIPKVDAKLRNRDELVNMYIEQKQIKNDEEIMRKSLQKDMFKAQIMSSLEEQTRANKFKNKEQKKQQAALDRKQLDYTIAKDEEWRKREEKKNLERR